MLSASHGVGPGRRTALTDSTCVMRRVPRTLGVPVHLSMVLGGRSEEVTVQRDSPQIQAEVVLPCHADPTVQLHAVLHDRLGVLAEEGLAAHPQRRIAPARPHPLDGRAR